MAITNIEIDVTDEERRALYLAVANARADWATTVPEDEDYKHREWLAVRLGELLTTIDEALQGE